MLTSSYAFSFSSEKVILGFIVVSILFLGKPVMGTMKSIFFTVCFLSLVFFFTSNVFIFYLTFETTILPVGMMILFWGSQPERISALFFMVLYSVVSAFPLLFGLLFVPSSFLDMAFSFSSLLILSLSLTFFVKMPLFGLHLWLPKAHVEAPSLGSIVLAGLLLKLGAWGLLLLSEHLILISGFLWLVGSLGMILGALLASFQSDSKSLVAYSSVCHMNFMVMIFIFMPSLMKSGSLVMMFAHGVTSSFMFWITGVMFYLKYSRQLLFLGGLSTASASMVILTTIIFFTNFGVPPSITFFQESSFILMLFSSSCISLLVLGAYLMVVCYYTLFYLSLFSLSGGKTKSSSILMESVSLFGVIFSFNLLVVSFLF